MSDPTPIGQTLTAPTPAATEIVTDAHGHRGVIQWQGTPVASEWVTAYVESLILARLVEPWQSRTGTPEQQAKVRAANRDRLGLWHTALAGLPMEGLEAAREHFIRNGPATDRWFLRPSDVSSWVRARARRRIPDGQECPEHPDQWGHSCQPCKDARRASVTPDLIRTILDRAKETT